MNRWTWYTSCTMASYASYTPFGSSTGEELLSGNLRTLATKPNPVKISEQITIECEDYHAEQIEKAKSQRKSWEAAEAIRFRREEQRRADIEKLKVDAVKKVALLEQQVADLQARVAQLEGQLQTPPPSKAYMICGMLY